MKKTLKVKNYSLFNDMGFCFTLFCTLKIYHQIYNLLPQKMKGTNTMKIYAWHWCNMFASQSTVTS